MQKCEQGVKWDYYNRFETINDKYLPRIGEGDNMATQICTALNKLVYKWYNDGDVYDNTYSLEGWLNDLSSYANWIYKYLPLSQKILDRIEDVDEQGYECLLKDLVDKFLNKETLSYYEKQEKVDSIYECKGKFKFIEHYYEDDEDEEMWFNKRRTYIFSKRKGQQRIYRLQKSNHYGTIFDIYLEQCRCYIWVYNSASLHYGNGWNLY